MTEADRVVCRSCGAVTEVVSVGRPAPCVKPAAVVGFEVDDAEVTFWGLCPACQPAYRHPHRGPARPAEVPPLDGRPAEDRMPPQ